MTYIVIKQSNTKNWMLQCINKVTETGLKLSKCTCFDCKGHIVPFEHTKEVKKVLYVHKEYGEVFKFAVKNNLEFQITK